MAVCVLAGAKLLDSTDDTVAVWALRADLEGGSPIGAQDLVRRDIGFLASSDADRYVSAETSLPADATLQRSVGVGELLPRAALGEGRSGPVTEVPLGVSADAVPHTVKAGSVVDIWAVPDPTAGTRAGESVLIFEDVVVISASATGSALSPSGTRQIVIAVEQSNDDQLADALATAARGTTLVTRQG